MDEDRGDVEASIADFVDAFNQLDWERFRGCFADDATVFHPANAEVRDRLERAEGRKEVEASFRLVFAEARKGKSAPPYLNIRPRDVKIQQLGETVVIVSFHFDRGASSFGRRTLVMQKRGDQWLIVHLHASNVKVEVDE
jgi:ketosteroid isomerase-like protein